jgi:hypothetical protein
MSSIIKVKRGTTTPTTGLAEHEIAVDTTAKRIYIGALDGSGILVGSAPAGSTTQVQFNNAGVLGASAGLVFDSANEILRVRSHATRYFTIGPNAGGSSEILAYGNRSLSINSVGSTIDIGDIGAAVNGTYIQIDDPLPALSINCPGGTIDIDSPTVVFTGTISADAYILSSDGIQAKTANYSLVAADNGKIITMNVASANTLTVPASLAVGFNCTVIQLGAGQTTITASGTTLNSYQGYLKISGQHGSASIVSYTSNVYNVAGSLSA